MQHMKAVQVAKANAGLEVVEKQFPSQKRAKCASSAGLRVCHRDMFAVTGAYPGIQYPRVPSHEVVGIIDAVGTDVPDTLPRS